MSSPPPKRDPQPLGQSHPGSLDQALSAISRSNDELRAFVSVADRSILERLAAEADQRRAAGRSLGSLDGITVAVKDNVDTVDQVTTMGSALFADRRPSNDAEVVRRLRSGGALIVGKTNMTELACGTTGRNEWLGDVGNPLNADRFPGGSSSGSAAAVAAGMAEVAIGTDTTCSIRYPAAACGIVGLKPTIGRISTAGVGVCSRLLDHVGPMARRAETVARALLALQVDGADDPTQLLGVPPTGLRIGVLGGDFIDTCRPGIAAAFGSAVEGLGVLGCSVLPAALDVDLDAVGHSADVLCREMYSIYGERLAAAPDRAGTEVRDWFAGYRSYDETDLELATAHRLALIETVATTMARFDALICPTMRAVPGTWDENENDADHRADRVANCVLWSMTGQPSLTVPYGIAEAEMPAATLITGRPGHDATVLQLAAALQSTDLDGGPPAGTL